MSSPLVYCQYDIILPLSATTTSPGNQLVWYNSPSGGTGSASPPTPSSSLPSTTNYWVSQVNNGCEGPRVVITVTIVSKLALSDQQIKICYGDTADLASLYNTTGFNSSWTFNGEIIDSPINVRVPGTYQLIIQNSSGCGDTAIVSLNVYPPLVANAGPDDNAELSVPYQLNGSGGLHYLWAPAGLLNNPNISNPVAVLTQDTSFILTVSDNLGCSDVDSVRIRVLKGPAFYVPSAFSPNGDGLNDEFLPTAVGILSLDYFKIFNRYGELVFETKELEKGWDGTYKYVRQNGGNYVWLLQGTDRNNKKIVKKGNVLLVR